LPPDKGNTLYQAAEKGPGARRCVARTSFCKAALDKLGLSPASKANAAEDVLGRNPEGNSYLRLQRRWHHGQGRGPSLRDAALLADAKYLVAARTGTFSAACYFRNSLLSIFPSRTIFLSRFFASFCPRTDETCGWLIFRISKNRF
jgi:hypothetical protein